MPFRNTPTAPLLQSFLEFWRRCGAGGIPTKAALDPIGLARGGFMPHIWLVERVGEDRFVYRIAGERIIEVLGFYPRGKELHDLLPGPVAQELAARWSKLLDERLGYHNHGKIVAPDGGVFIGERLGLPLVDSAGEPRFVVGVTQYLVRDRLPEKRPEITIRSEPSELLTVDDLLSGD